jgi:hypothetical protein
MYFENRVLRRIFGPKRNELTGEWRKLYNEELHELYCSPIILPINVYIYGAAANASKWQMGFNSAFKGLNREE